MTVYFQFLGLRDRVELHHLTGHVIECPLDEMNRPRASVAPLLRIPPSEAEIEQLFAGWRQDLAACRKFAPTARNYAVARPAADVGLRINEARMLDLDDVRWELGRFGKLNVRHGKDSGRVHGNLHRPQRYNRALQRVFYTSALISIQSCPDSRRFYDRNRAEGKRHTQAVLALARRRVNVLWALLRDGRVYQLTPPLPAAA